MRGVGSEKSKSRREEAVMGSRLELSRVEVDAWQPTSLVVGVCRLQNEATSEMDFGLCNTEMYL